MLINFFWTRSIMSMLKAEMLFQTTNAYSSWGRQIVVYNLQNGVGELNSLDSLQTEPRVRIPRTGTRLVWAVWAEKCKVVSKSTPRPLISRTLRNGTESTELEKEMLAVLRVKVMALVLAAFKGRLLSVHPSEKENRPDCRMRQSSTVRLALNIFMLSAYRRN